MAKVKKLILQILTYNTGITVKSFIVQVGGEKKTETEALEPEAQKQNLKTLKMLIMPHFPSLGVIGPPPLNFLRP